MKLLARTIATVLLASLALVAAPTTAQASLGDCQSDDPYVRSLEVRVIEAEHEAHNLRVTIEEERDEHADEIRFRNRQAWEAGQAHDAEVNEFSALAQDARVDLDDFKREAAATLLQRNLQIVRLRSTVQRLRDRLRTTR